VEKDIYVEIDAIQTTSAITSRDFPDDNVITILEESFKLHSINLHVDTGTGIHYLGGANRVFVGSTVSLQSPDDDDFSNPPRPDKAIADNSIQGWGYPNDFYDIKWGGDPNNPRSDPHWGWDINGNHIVDDGDVIEYGNFNPERFKIFHYALIYDMHICGASDSFHSDDFIFDQRNECVGHMGNRYELAAVIMHELGHNLGLHHFGDADQPDDSREYVSVMSYYYSVFSDRWPSEWNGYPNYGFKPGGWYDWDEIKIPVSAGIFNR